MGDTDCTRNVFFPFLVGFFWCDVSSCLRVALDIFFGVILYSNDSIDDHGLLVIMDFLDPLAFYQKRPSMAWIQEVNRQKKWCQIWLSMMILVYHQNWLVVSIHLKNISQIGSFPQIGMKMKHIWNHHPNNDGHITWHHVDVFNKTSFWFRNLYQADSDSLLDPCCFAKLPKQDPQSLACGSNPTCQNRRHVGFLDASNNRHGIQTGPGPMPKHRKHQTLNMHLGGVHPGNLT